MMRLPWIHGLVTLMLLGSVGAYLRSSVLVLDDEYKEIVHAYCPHDGKRQLTMFGLTSDGFKINIFSLTRQEQILRDNMHLDQPGLHISVTESCQNVVVTQDWALTTFDPQHLAQKQTFFTVGLLGRAIATDKGYAVGFTVFQEFGATSVCLNLTNAAIRNCSNCHPLHWPHAGDINAVVHPTDDWMYVYDLDSVYKVKLEETCMQEVYKLPTTNVFGSNDAFFVNRGQRIMNSNGTMFLAADLDTYRHSYDLFPDGGFHGLNASLDTNRSMFKSISQYNKYPDTVFAIKERYPEILAFSWPDLAYIGEISIPPLYLSTGAKSSEHTPISVYVDHSAAPYELYVVSRYVVSGRIKYGLAYIYRNINLTPSPVVSRGKYVPDVAVPELGLYAFDAESYDQFDMCVGGDGSYPAVIVAYKHDVVVFFGEDFSLVRDPLRLQHPIRQMAFEPTCKHMAFSHSSFLTIMSLATGAFRTLATSVRHPSSLMYAGGNWTMLFPRESDQPAVYCTDLERNTTQSCWCGEHMNTLAYPSQDSRSIYTLSQGLFRQILTKLVKEPSSCAQKKQEKTGMSSDYYGFTLWVSPDDKLIIMSDGRVFMTDNLTHVGDINDRFETKPGKYLSFATTEDRNMVLGIVNRESFIIVYEYINWPILLAMRYVYVQSGCANIHQPVRIRYNARSGKLLVVSNITEFTGKRTTGVMWVDVSVRHRHPGLYTIQNRIRINEKCQENIVNPYWKSVPEYAKNDRLLKSTRRSRTLTSTGGWLGPTTQPWWKNTTTAPDVLVTGESSSVDVVTGRSWSFYASIFGVCLLVITIVVTVSLVLVFTVCSRRRPHSIMTNPLLGAMVTQPDTTATDHDQQDTTQVDSNQGHGTQVNESTRQVSYGSHYVGRGPPPQRSSQGHVLQNQVQSSHHPGLTFYQPYQQVSNSQGLMGAQGAHHGLSQAVYFSNQPVQAVTQQDASQSDHSIHQEASQSDHSVQQDVNQSDHSIQPSVDQNSVYLKLGETEDKLAEYVA